MSVRLACIRHAASVHPEPGSNSPYFGLRLLRVNRHPHRDVCGVRFFTCSFLSTRLLLYLLCFPITIQLLRCPRVVPEKQKTGSTARYRLQTAPFFRMCPFVGLSSVCCLPRMCQSLRPVGHGLTLEYRGVYQALVTSARVVFNEFLSPFVFGYFPHDAR